MVRFPSAALILLAVLLACLFAPPALRAEGETVRLLSLYWPPYTGRGLPGGGATSTILRKALDSVGMDLEIHFYPWRRVLYQMDKKDSPFDGYFPEYRSEELARKFLLSRSLGTSPLGLAERLDKLADWRTLDDLKGISIGVVSGYVNTRGFDRMAAKGALKVDGANDDEENLLKLLYGRVDLAVIDRNVFGWLLGKEPLRMYRGALRINSRLLAIHDLHVCFRKSERGRQLREVLDRALSSMAVLELQEEWMAAFMGKKAP